MTVSKTNKRAKKVSSPSHPDAFNQFTQSLEKWFYQPDLQAMRIVLGTAKAHYLKIGDPAWLYVVAPPGTGKTTTSIMAACGLPEVVTLGDISENTFLSGFYKHKEPGVLEKLGKTSKKGNTYLSQGNGLFLLKDFTTVLSMRREKRKAILSQLREIHDGEFKRSFGTGETKIWRGRVTIIAAVTPVLDRHYAIFTTLGERFLQVRWHRPNSPEAGEWAINQQGHETEIQGELRGAVKEIFGQSSKEPPELGLGMPRRIAHFAEVIAVARTHVYRESYGDRDIEYVPEPEANTRISKGLAAIAKGIAALNRHKMVSEEDLQDALRVGLDCLTEIRRRILLAAIEGQELQSLGIPWTTRERAYEDLRQLKILDKTRVGEPLQFTDRVETFLKTAKLSLGVSPNLFGVSKLKQTHI